MRCMPSGRVPCFRLGTVHVPCMQRCVRSKEVPQKGDQTFPERPAASAHVLAVSSQNVPAMCPTHSSVGSLIDPKHAWMLWLQTGLSGGPLVAARTCTSSTSNIWSRICEGSWVVFYATRKTLFRQAGITKRCVLANSMFEVSGLDQSAKRWRLEVPTLHIDALQASYATTTPSMVLV